MLAFIPIVLLVMLMVALNQPAKVAILCGWLLCCARAFIFWKMSPGSLV